MRLTKKSKLPPRVAPVKLSPEEIRKRAYAVSTRAVNNILNQINSRRTVGQRISAKEVQMILGEKKQSVEEINRIAEKIPISQLEHLRVYHDFLHTNPNFENLMQAMASRKMMFEINMASRVKK